MKRKSYPGEISVAIVNLCKTKSREGNRIQRAQKSYHFCCIFLWTPLAYWVNMASGFLNLIPVQSCESRLNWMGRLQNFWVQMEFTLFCYRISSQGIYIRRTNSDILREKPLYQYLFPSYHLSKSFLLLTSWLLMRGKNKTATRYYSPNI